MEKIEAEEVRLDLRAKVKQAITRARLFGGSAIFIGTGETNTAVPLNPGRIQAGGLKYLAVMNRRQLSPTEIEKDPQSERFGKPKAYRLADSQLEIHPSRLVIFSGAEHPDPDLALPTSSAGAILCFSPYSRQSSNRTAPWPTWPAWCSKPRST
ncbi:anti-CBASS protein Acb1 family protein [Pseudomonas asiatica]|uniref:anti-CBASS protein Acb1 family protein n=1 Tax=Pseudomonas asiatica TaxID=2219225 RepID=UPI00207B8788|nr:anti-CBASS Acb1 family protein [Pseudomonas asiatica]